MVRNSNFFQTFGPPFGTPLPKWMALCQNVRRSVPYMRLQSAALGDAKENRNGRRLSPYRRKPQNWYYVTHFLAHPENPVTDESKHIRQLDREEIKLFFIPAYMPLFLIVSEIYGRKVSKW